MSWNPIFDKVIEVKREWQKLPCTDMFRVAPTFLKMLEELNRKEYNDIFNCLQINQDGNLILIRYGLAEMQAGMWRDPNSIYRECRSVVIDIKNECLVLTPFRKFFNLNEVEENKLDVVMDKLKTAKNVEIVDKLDGSMQSARWYNGKPLMAGSMALNPKDSWRLADGYNMLSENYISMLRDYPAFTFIFEFISVRDAHVVKYSKKEEGLYLIGIRNTMTGTEFDYKDIKELARVYHIPVANIESITLEQVLEDMKVLSADKKEGWVLNIDGHKIKIKCDDYVELHRVLDKISSINVIIKNIAEGRVDDMVSKIPSSHRDRVSGIIEVISNYVVETELTINNYYNQAPKNIKKDFMIWISNNVPPKYRSFVRCKYLDVPYNVLKNGGGGYKLVSELGLEDKVKEVLSNGE